MTKEQFKEKQIEIYEAEQNLASKTHATLFLMLESMSEEEIEAFIDTDHYIDENYEIITSINQNRVITRNEDTGENMGYDLEALTQAQQKEIIDTIMIHVWKM